MKIYHIKIDILKFVHQCPVFSKEVKNILLKIPLQMAF